MNIPSWVANIIAEAIKGALLALLQSGKLQELVEAYALKAEGTEGEVDDVIAWVLSWIVGGSSVSSSE